MKLEQLETPALVLDMNIFDENQDKMMKLVNDLGVALRPHYKSNKCLAIVHEQLKKSAKGITCAKVSYIFFLHLECKHLILYNIIF